MRILSNPITVKELRSRMRGVRAILPMVAYLAIVSTYLLFQFYEFGQNFRFVDLVERGKYIGYFIMYGQLLFVYLVTPAYASSAITVEKEMETFDVMLTTNLSMWEIVSGKVFSGFLYTTLMLVSSLPLIALAFWMGGFDFSDLIWGFLIIESAALLFTCIGIMFSALSLRSYKATGVTYTLVIGGAIFSVVFITIVETVNMGSANTSFQWDTIPVFLMYTLNPFLMMFYISDYGVGSISNPIIDSIEIFLSAYGVPYTVIYILIYLGFSVLTLNLAGKFLFRESRKDK